MSADRRLQGGKRMVALFLASFGCALLSLFVPALVSWLFTGEDSGRRGAGSFPIPWWYFLTALPVVTGFALVGFVPSLYSLWNVDLRKAIPLVTLVTVGVAAAPIPWLGFFPFPLTGPVVALGAGLLTMQWCRSLSPWVLRDPPAPSVFRVGLRGLKSKLDSERR